MNSDEENFKSMIAAVLLFNANAPASIKDALPGYNDLIDLLETKYRELSTFNGAQGSSRVGFQREKTAGKEAVVTKTMTIVFSAKAYAIATNDLVLESKMKALTKFKLLRYRDSKTADFAEEVITIATAIQPDLEPYGITPELLGIATHAVTDFRAEMAKPRVAIVNRAEITANIKALFKQCRTLFYQLDSLVNSIFETQPEFHSTYFRARTIINLHGSTLSVRGFVTDTNGNPIEKVVVTAAEGKRTTKTTLRGYFEFKNLPVGIDTIKFTKGLYIDNSQVVSIVKGERVQLNITLENVQSSSGAA